MALTDFTIIRRSMTARLFSTVTTVLTVAVAVALMLVLLSMRQSGRKAFERGSGNMHLLISADSNALTAVLNGIYYANPPQRPIAWPKFNETVAGVFGSRGPDIANGSFAIPVQMGDSFRGSPVAATTPEFFTAFKPDPQMGWELASGRFFEREFEVVAGSAAASSHRLKLDQNIVLTHGAGTTGHEHAEFKYTVVGILKPTGSAHDRALFTNLDSTWLIHAYDRIEHEGGHDHTSESGDAHDDHAHEDHAHDDHDHDHAHDGEPPITVADLIEDDRKITGIYLRLPTRGGGGAETSAILPQVFDQLRRDPSITVAQPAQQISNLFDIVSNIDQIFLALAAVVMVSSGIAVMLALYNSMEQRRRQIAVLRVLGASRGRIFGLILTESAMIGFLGAALGLVLAHLGASIVASVMKERLGLVIDPEVEIRTLLSIVLSTIALAAVAGLVPAVMAYRTPVARNLKPIG